MLSPLAIAARDLWIHYGVRPILSRVSFEIREGDCTAIIGPNASGKTTLLAALAGLLSPQHGTIEVFGLPRRTTVEDELRIRRRVCYLPMGPFGPMHLTVRQGWLAIAELYQRDMAEAFDQVERLAAAFGLAASLDSPTHSLSTGQQRKTQIAGAIMSDAELLLLDEPFSGGLDPAGIRALKSILRHLVRERGRTVVFTIPVPELIEDLADQLIVLSDRQIVIDASPSDVMAQVPGVRTLSDALARLAFAEVDDDVEAYVASEAAREQSRRGDRAARFADDPADRP